MLGEWFSQAKKGSPTFIEEGSTLTIINDVGERGVWSAVATVYPDEEFILSGVWAGIGQITVRLLWHNDGDELASFVVEGGSTPLKLSTLEGANTLQINCILSGEGSAVFEDITLVTEGQEPADDFLPIPAADATGKQHVTGWKWGRNIMLTVHDPAEGDFIAAPPDYGIPYEVKGWQHGRRLDLEIGNMHIDEEE